MLERDYTNAWTIQLKTIKTLSHKLKEGDHPLTRSLDGIHNNILGFRLVFKTFKYFDINSVSNSVKYSYTLEHSLISDLKSLVIKKIVN